MINKKELTALCQDLESRFQEDHSAEWREGFLVVIAILESRLRSTMTYKPVSFASAHLRASDTVMRVTLAPPMYDGAEVATRRVLGRSRRTGDVFRQVAITRDAVSWQIARYREGNYPSWDMAQWQTWCVSIDGAKEFVPVTPAPKHRITNTDNFRGKRILWSAEHQPRRKAGRYSYMSYDEERQRRGRLKRRGPRRAALDTFPITPDTDTSA